MEEEEEKNDEFGDFLDEEGTISKSTSGTTKNVMMEST